MKPNFLAVDGPHYAKISESGDWVSLQMIDVDNITNDGDAYVLNTGSPHYVLQTTDLSKKMFIQKAKPYAIMSYTRLMASISILWKI